MFSDNGIQCADDCFGISFAFFSHFQNQASHQVHNVLVSYFMESKNGAAVSIYKVANATVNAVCFVKGFKPALINSTLSLFIVSYLQNFM